MWIRQVKRGLGWRKGAAWRAPVPDPISINRPGFPVPQEPSPSLRDSRGKHEQRFFPNARHNCCHRIVLIAQGRRSGRPATGHQRLRPQQHRTSASPGRRRIRVAGAYPPGQPSSGPAPDRGVPIVPCREAGRFGSLPLRQSASPPDSRRRPHRGNRPLHAVLAERPVLGSIP